MRAPKGAAAVEFALVLPILLVLVLGIMEFGYLAYANASAAGAAREGARTLALTKDQEEAERVTLDYFVIAGASAKVDFVGDCSKPGKATVTASYTYKALTGWFGSSFTARGIGEMRCGG